MNTTFPEGLWLYSGLLFSQGCAECVLLERDFTLISEWIFTWGFLWEFFSQKNTQQCQFENTWEKLTLWSSTYEPPESPEWKTRKALLFYSTLGVFFTFAIILIEMEIRLKEIKNINHKLPRRQKRFFY